MALKDLLRPRIIELGKIKIGGLGEQRTSRGGKQFRLPQKHDYFTLTTLHRTQTGDLAPDEQLMRELTAAGYADKDGRIRRLPVFVLSNDPDQVMQSAWAWYAGRKCWAKSDGKIVTWYGDPKTMKKLDDPVEEEWDDSMASLADPKGNQLFKLHSTFNCVIAASASKWGGVYKLRTTSRITAEQLYGGMQHILELTGGVLRGLELELCVRPMNVQPDGVSTTIYVVHLQLIGKSLMQIQERARDLARFAIEYKHEADKWQRDYESVVTVPGEGEDDDEQARIQQEFHPDDEQSTGPPIGRVHANDEATYIPEPDLDDPDGPFAGLPESEEA